MLTYYVVWGMIGACVGSFGVWVAQQLVSTSAVDWWRRSRCDHCHRVLNWWQLIPIFSSVVAQWRCGKCRQPYSRHYCVVECLCSVVFLVLAYRCRDWTFIQHMSLVAITVCLIVMSVCDYLEQWVPDKLQVLLLVTCLVYRQSLLHSPPLLYCAWIVLVFGCLYWLLPHKIGGADIKLFCILSLVVPITHFPLLLLLSSVFGGLHLLLTRQACIPFVPSIALSCLIVLLTPLP